MLSENSIDETYEPLFHAESQFERLHNDSPAKKRAHYFEQKTHFNESAFTKKRRASDVVFSNNRSPMDRSEFVRRVSDLNRYPSCHIRRAPSPDQWDNMVEKINAVTTYFNADDNLEPIPWTSCKETSPPNPETETKTVTNRNVSSSINTATATTTSSSSKTKDCSAMTVDEEICLGKAFQPGSWDVVCGRGKNWRDYHSNRRFRILVSLHLHQYFENISRKNKSKVINTIVTTVQQAGSFVRRADDENWYRISIKDAREKVSHCLRDSLQEPQSVQSRWTKQERNEKVREAQDTVFRSLDLMA